MLSLSLLLIECKKKKKKKVSGEYEFSTIFFLFFKVQDFMMHLCKKIAMVLVVNMSLAWHKKLKM